MKSSASRSPRRSPTTPSKRRELEILVLRHQLSVLQRTAGRPRLQAGDRFVLAAIAQRLPRSAWRSLEVCPDTVVRWHRQLVRRNARRSGAAVASAGHRSRRTRGISSSGWPRTIQLGDICASKVSCASSATTCPAPQFAACFITAGFHPLRDGTECVGAISSSRFWGCPGLRLLHRRHCAAPSPLCLLFH